jgi:molybdenum cofactor biosynthesis enzyme
LADSPVEVHCACDPALAARRYNDRARTCHPIHVLASVPADVRAEYDRPVGIGKLVTVNTATPVDVPAVAAAIRAQLPRPPDGERCG